MYDLETFKRLASFGAMQLRLTIPVNKISKLNIMFIEYFDPRNVIAYNEYT